MLKTIVLPRQARDNHREKLKKEWCFLTASQSNLTGWLYWYINYGWEKGGPNTGNMPLQPIEQRTGYSDFNVTVANGNFWTNSDGNWMYPVRKPPFRGGVILKWIILPRQARDKHRKR